MDLWQVFRSWSASLNAPLDALRQIPHKSERGRQAEKVFRDLLSKRLPARLGITSGFVFGVSPPVSHHLDAIVYDALDCPILLDGDAPLLPVDSVIAACEITLSLTADKLRQDCRKLAQFRALRGLLAPPKDFADPAPLAFSVAFDSPLTLDALARNFLKIARRNRQQGADAALPNGVVILSKGILCYAHRTTQGTEFHFHPTPFHHPDAHRLGIAWFEAGEYTIGWWYTAFLERVRILLENRIRAQAEWLVDIRSERKRRLARSPTARDSAGASVLIPRLREYFPDFHNPAKWPEDMRRRLRYAILPD